MKFIFCLQINTNVFCKLIVSLWVCVARHAQSTQSNKFAISLQYLKKEVRDGVRFLHADNTKVSTDRQMFGIIVFEESGQICLNCPK